MPRWRSAGRFQWNAAHRDEHAFTQSQHGFHAAVGALVLICFVATCRHDLLIGAR